MRGSFRWRALLSLAPLAACSDGPTAGSRPTEPAPAPAFAAVACQARVTDRVVACGAPTLDGATLNQHTLGGQGFYVRLASTAVSYTAGVFSFDVTVQNLSTLAMATSDGASRDAGGVRVFFVAPPVVTSGTGSIVVANPTGTGSFTAAGQPYYQYGGAVGGVDQGELGADGILPTGEVSTGKSWQLSVPPTVATFSFTVYVSTQTPAGTILSAAPQVTSVTPATLVPGTLAQVNGTNFDASPGSNLVLIGGQPAAVLGGSPTQLSVMVPCASSGSAAVQVSRAGMAGAPFAHPLAAPTLSLAPGQSVILASLGQGECNELTPTGGPARYLLAVFNFREAPGSSSSFVISADSREGMPASPAAPARVVTAPDPGLEAQLARERQRRADEAHLRILEENRRAYTQLRARFAGDPRMQAPAREGGIQRVIVPPPATDVFTIDDPSAFGPCSQPIPINATRVYHAGRVAIYEDDTNPIRATGPAANPTLAAYLTAMGEQYNADMEPIVRTHIGDPLRRDAVTDNNGVLIALFSHEINDRYPGVYAYVTSCDQFPNDVSNPASNFGEFFYATVPVSTAPGYVMPGTMDYWYWSMRTTFIHEVKHIASMSARVAGGAPSFEVSWLEEATARHAEELWARNAVYNVAWKGNTGYGSPGAPGSVYCDSRQMDPACLATDPARPSLNMYSHFAGLYGYMANPVAYSPFGQTALGGASFYGSGWSLVRYAIDRYATTEAAFLTALNSAGEVGMTNLAARSGVNVLVLQGGWSMALYADDWPSGSVGPDLSIPTWNLRSAYAGLHADFPATFTAPYPLSPTPLAFGSLSATAIPSVAGGGVAYFEFSGTHTAPQLVRLGGPGGSTLPTFLRVAIARLP